MSKARITGAARRGAWLVLVIGLGSAAAFATAASEPEPLTDPKRPPAAELETSVADGFTLAAVGDCILSHQVSQKRARDPGFDAVVKILLAADATFGNLETSIVDVRSFAGFPDAGAGDWLLTSHPAVAQDLAAMGFDLLSRANNHALDWGIEGMRETGGWLDAAGLVHAGAGENRGLARAPRYFESGKGRVALVSLASTYAPGAAATPARGSTAGRPGLSALRLERFVVAPPATMRTLAGIEQAMGEARGRSGTVPTEPPNELVLFDTQFRLGDGFAYRYEVNPIDVAEILGSIRLGKQHADFLIVSIHALETAFDEDSPGDFLRPLAHRAIDAGADVFLVHGIHHLGPIEVYRGRPIFYGLANFFWSDIQEPLDPVFREAYAEKLAAAFPDPANATDADLAVLVNAESFDDERVFQTLIAVTRFESGRAAEIRLHPVDLGYGRRLTESGVPRLASPAQG